VAIEEQGPPELVVPTGLAMSGRLDSNQRPPEPHSGGARPTRRKSWLFPGLRITHSPHSTRRAPPIPQITLSFLQFPARRDDPESLTSLFEASHGALGRRGRKRSAGGSLLVPAATSHRLGGRPACGRG